MWWTATALSVVSPVGVIRKLTRIPFGTLVLKRFRVADARVPSEAARSARAGLGDAGDEVDPRRRPRTSGRCIAGDGIRLDREQALARRRIVLERAPVAGADLDHGAA